MKKSRALTLIFAGIVAFSALVPQSWSFLSSHTEDQDYALRAKHVSLSDEELNNVLLKGMHPPRDGMLVDFKTLIP